jgi:hypothetical protein
VNKEGKKYGREGMMEIAKGRNYDVSASFLLNKVFFGMLAL